MGVLSKLILCRRESRERKVQEVDGSNITMIPDLVLDKIFAELDWGNLKNCRLVCDRWEKLLRETKFLPKNICYEYNLCRPLIPVSSLQTLRKPFRSRTKKIKLEFHTMRFRSPLSSLFAPDVATILSNLSTLKYELKSVTRLELNLSGFVRKYCFGDMCDLVEVIYKFDNIMELFVTEVAVKGVMFGIGDTDCQRLLLLCGDEQNKLKKLKKFVYTANDPDIYVGHFLKVISNCNNLVNFQIRISYERIVWENHFRPATVYKLIGIILKNNASTLENVCIGVTKYDDQFMGFSDNYDLWNLESLSYLSRTKREEFWMKTYHTDTDNYLFEYLLNKIGSDNWKDFGLNNLEHLTLEFREVVYPTSKIESILIPFVNSLVSLKTLTIQPIVAFKTEGSSFVTHMSYLANIIDTSKFGATNSGPKLMSDIIYFSDSTCIDVVSLWNKCQYSALHLVFKISQDTNWTRNICRKNVSWKNVPFALSLVVPHLRLLTTLVIYQNKHCHPGAVLSMKDADFQLIFREGKSIQKLFLKCDLSAVTPFGYTGIPVSTVNDLKSIPLTALEARRKAKRGLSILDLKALTYLVLTRLNGQYTIESPSTSDMRLTDFEMLKNYFLGTNRLENFLLGYERLTTYIKTCEDGSKKLEDDIDYEDYDNYEW